MGTRGSFPGGKAARHEADHSPPSGTKVKNAWSYTSTPQYIFMAWCLGTALPLFGRVSSDAIMSILNFITISPLVQKLKGHIHNMVIL
jgi:hypothetical protein